MQYGFCSSSSESSVVFWITSDGTFPWPSFWHLPIGKFQVISLDISQGYRITNKAMLYTIKQVALGNESGLNFLCCSHKCKRQLENIYSWTSSITYDRTTVQRVCDSTKVIEWLHGRADSRIQNF